jgi:hypothetical protein
MLIQAHSGGNGFGYGFSAAGLTQGKDFNCNNAICYAIGPTNDALFKQLQMKTNVFSGAAGFKPLTVDGFIGAATVTALQAIKRLGLATAPSTKEAVAANAGMLIDLLQNLAVVQQAGGMRPSPSGTAVAYQPPPGVHQTTTIGPVQIPGMSPAAAALPKVKSKTLWWILGGVVAVLGVGGVGYIVYRRKARG